MACILNILSLGEYVCLKDKIKDKIMLSESVFYAAIGAHPLQSGMLM